MSLEHDPDVALDETRRKVLLEHARVIAGVAKSDGPLTAAHAFRPPAEMTNAQGLGLLAAMALVLLSSFASGWLLATLGVRAAASLMLAIAVGAALGLRGVGPAQARSSLLQRSLLQRSLLLGMLGIAAITGASLALMLVPAVVHGIVAALLFASLRDEQPLIFKAARISHPLAPMFILPYCRRLTLVFAGLFAASAAVVVLLALAGDVERHRAWTGWLFWTLLALFSFVEFFFRKAWFRYFGQGPFDQLLARVFPPEKTERGRRSQAYVLRMRSELARLAELERQKKLA